MTRFWEQMVPGGEPRSVSALSLPPHLYGTSQSRHTDWKPHMMLLHFTCSDRSAPPPSPPPTPRPRFPLVTRATLSTRTAFTKCLLSCTPRCGSGDGLLGSINQYLRLCRLQNVLCGLALLASHLFSKMTAGELFLNVLKDIQTI